MVYSDINIQKIAKAQQLIVVTTDNWQSVRGRLWCFKKKDKKSLGDYKDCKACSSR